MLVYPSMTLALLELGDPELARAACRAVNARHARLFAPYRDRLLPGALISLVTPEVGLDVLEHAVGELGLRTGVISNYARRPIPAIERRYGATVPPVYRCDVFGMDSEYDYDPFWARCVSLGFAPVSHGGFQYHHVARSPSSYVYNHIGGLSRGHEALAKALVLGGVTARFPALRVGFLEGGVAWACSLLADLVGHFEKRNADAIHALDPDRLDVAALLTWLRSHGDDAVRAAEPRLRAYFASPGARPEQLDEFAACHAKDEIATASLRVAVMGGAISRFGDIHQALGYRWTPEGRETLFLRSKVLVDCRAAGIRYPVSGMWGGDVSDLDGPRRFARELRELGYYGMMLGAAAHVALVKELFTPTREEVAYWRELVRLAEEVERCGRGPVLYGDPDRGEGHVVHLAHVASARLNLEWAEALGVG